MSIFLRQTFISGMFPGCTFPVFRYHGYWASSVRYSKQSFIGVYVKADEMCILFLFYGVLLYDASLQNIEIHEGKSLEISNLF